VRCLEKTEFILT